MTSTPRPSSSFFTRSIDAKRYGLRPWIRWDFLMLIVAGPRLRLPLLAEMRRVYKRRLPNGAKCEGEWSTMADGVDACATRFASSCGADVDAVASAAEAREALVRRRADV